MADIKLSDENVIKVNLSVEGTINANVQDVNYVPGYVEAEKERRANELQRIANELSRISNEEERKQYILELKERVEKGEFNGKDGEKGEDGAVQYTAGANIEITGDNVINVTGIGNLENLDTTAKDNLVSAINELVNSSGGTAGIEYIETNNFVNPFIFSEHDKGIYVFRSGTAIYCKAFPSSNDYIRFNVSDTILCVYEKLTEETPNNTGIGFCFSYRNERMTIKTASSESSGLTYTTGYVLALSPAENHIIEGTYNFSTLPRSTVVPTLDSQLTNKKYVDDAVASAGGSDDSISEYYITDAISTNSPFILEGRKPGIYWLPNVSGTTTLYMKGTASNNTNFIKGIYGPLHIVKEYTTASDNEVVALYQSNVGTYFAVLKSSRDSSGLTRGTKINNYFDLVGTKGTQNLTNQFNFTSLIPKITSSTSPTEDTHIVTKGYVDNAISGVGGITEETDPTVPSHVKSITASQVASWDNAMPSIGSLKTLTTTTKTDLVMAINELDSCKQETLTAGNNISITNNTISVTGIFEAIFPIGRGFIDFTNTDYSNYLGFTWERELVGLTPVGIDSTDSDFDTIGKTGGEKTHTLVHSEMPNFKFATAHVGFSDSVWSATNGTHIQGSGRGWTNQQDEASRANVNGGAYHEFSFGDSQAHNNLQPYKVVAYWKRTA